MPKFEAGNLRGLLAMLLVSCTGCAAQWCHLPDDCVHTFNQTQLGWELNDICNSCQLDNCGCGEGVDCGCGVHVYEDAAWLGERCSKPACRRPRIAVGPPPVPYEPPMPPEFLPVPARSVFSQEAFVIRR